ncbi:MAG: NADH-quinone oxidoreductase subunit N [Bdellovibrionaceae bacterium]|nr:NADH-quinone oxidoreductase subunit N [Pseudobdellovibrionaceae bacterium]
MNEILKQTLLLSPLWTLFLMAFIPLTAKLLNNNKELKRETVCFIYALSFIASLVLFLVFGFNDKSAFSLQFDPYSSGACVLVNLSALMSLALIYFNSWIDKKHLTEILFLFSQGVLALYVFCLAQDLMTAFVGIETASLILYINLAMSKKELICLEAAIKYFVLSAFSSVVFLYGLSFLFGATGTLEMSQFFTSQENFNYNRFFILGFCLIFTSLFFKIALFPFHFWLADVYQGALSPLTLFMATGIKSSVVLFIGKLFSLPFFESREHGFIFLTGLATASVLTVLFGNIMALNQKNWKRLIAFSSLSHSGYLMMFLFGILSVSSLEKSFAGLFYYLLAYIFLTGGLITAVQCLEKQNSQAKLEDSLSLFKRNPLLASAFALFLLGLAGIPPSFGFFAKIGLFEALISSGSWWLLFWAFVGSAIGLYYYTKPVSFMLANEEKSSFPLSKLASLILILLMFFSIFGAFLFGKFFYY